MIGCLAATVVQRCVAFGEVTKFYWPNRWTERGLRRHLVLNDNHEFNSDLVDGLTFQDCIDLHDWHHLQLRVIRNNPKPAPFPEGKQVPETGEGRGETSKPVEEPWEEYIKRRTGESMEADKIAPKPLPVEVQEQLSQAIDVWKKAWADQDVDGYLNSYSSNFNVPRGDTRASWEELRRDRLTRPEYIKIDISNHQFVQIDEDVVEVRFRQEYKSNTFSDRTNKSLRMKREGDSWKILQEKNR